MKVVQVSGELDVLTAPELQDALAGVPCAGQSVIVNLTGVTFIDSTGLAALIGLWQSCNASSPARRMALVTELHTSPVIDRILDVSGLDTVFERFTSVELAIAHIERRDEGRKLPGARI